MPFLSPLLLAAALGCGSAATQTELNQCAAREAAGADDREARAYAALLAGAPAALRPSLRAAEEAWRTYRAAECRAEMLRYEGGTIVPMVYGLCRSGVDAERIARIRRSRTP